MATKQANWIAVAEPRFPWERDALDFVRERFPAHEPYRAWSNFEFIADDGSINEIDLLVFTPQGFFLVEIKSHPGRLFGDSGAWTWEHDGKLKTFDNPLFAANLKAKKLRSLLERQKAAKGKGRLPFLEALVFCSAPDLRLDLQDNARFHVCQRDREAVGETPARRGILAAILKRDCPGLAPTGKGDFNRPTVKLLQRAMEEAGIRESQRTRKVLDYALEQLLDEGPGYQDWQAKHVQIEGSKRRVRLYLVRLEADAEDRSSIERAAKREYQILDTLDHPGILRALNLTEHEVGPALVFEHDSTAIRLDHFLAQRHASLELGQRLDLVRQIAEALRYAHEKKVVHRALGPQSVLVTRHSDFPKTKVFNWQVGYREGGASTAVSRPVTATSHVDRFVGEVGRAYLAPEALLDEADGESLDIFSLGAIAYHVFSGLPPAVDEIELSEKLRDTEGLRLSAVLNGAPEKLEELIEWATHPIAAERLPTIADFIESLDKVEAELATPEPDYVEDPTKAQVNELIEGGYRVVRRLGQGATSYALLVERDDQDFVLKVARDKEHNERVRDEAAVLKKLRHDRIVDLVETLDLGGLAAFLMHPVFADKTKKTIETLGQRLRKEGRLHVDLLQRFGEDLLEVVNFLEEQGIPHRDIKPDNIAVGMIGRGDKLHLALFDFSLSRTPSENIRAGTLGYLDPLLPLRKPQRWDLHAERYAAAATLFELATGKLPKWGDGKTEPTQDAVEVTIDPEAFDPGLREPLTAFFSRAFRRDLDKSFHNAESMLREWRQCFEGIDEAGSLSDHADESQLRELLAGATFDTQIVELDLGTRATNALDRANILTVEDLLTVPLRRLLRLRGVGNKTRREISAAVKILRESLGTPSGERSLVTEEDEAEDSGDVATLSIDLLAHKLLSSGARDGETNQRACRMFLYQEPGYEDPWPSQADIGEALGVTRARVGQILGKLSERWNRPAVTALRDLIVEILDAQGGAMSLAEMAEALLVARGSWQDEPRRTQLASAALRAAVEVERTTAEPRFLVKRDGDVVVVARDSDLARYALRLGEEADKIAAEDPLVAPTRVVERLREIPGKPDLLLPESRLVRLAVAASHDSALSSRQELYPRGMIPARALKLSQGALLGVKNLTLEEIQTRVASRYPDAAPLPDRPLLDGLLREAGLEWNWDPEGKGGVGCYVAKWSDDFSVTSGTKPQSRQPTSIGPSREPGEITPEEADARQFEERLNRALKEGSFLTLLVSPQRYQQAEAELRRRFPLETIDYEGLFLEKLRETVDAANAKWEKIVETDARPREGNWDKLMILVRRCMPAVEERILAAEKPVLLTYPGLLARYDQMDLLARLSQKAGRRDGIPGLWLLVPGDNPLIDGQPVPLIGPGQKCRIPSSWLQNLHRANGK